MTTAHYMNVEMVHALGTILAIVDNDPESVRALLSAEVLGHVHHVPNQGLLVLPCLGKLRQTIPVFGNNQKVDRRLRIDVPKSNANVVVVDLVGRNVSRQDLVENRGRGSVASGVVLGGFLGLFNFGHGEGGSRILYVRKISRKRGNKMDLAVVVGNQRFSEKGRARQNPCEGYSKYTVTSCKSARTSKRNKRRGPSM